MPDGAIIASWRSGPGIRSHPTGIDLSYQQSVWMFIEADIIPILHTQILGDLDDEGHLVAAPKAGDADGTVTVHFRSSSQSR